MWPLRYAASKTRNINKITSQLTPHSALSLKYLIVTRIVKSLDAFRKHRCFCVVFTEGATRRYRIWAGEHNFSKKSGGRHKVLGARRVTWSKLHTDRPQMLGAIILMSVVRATWRLGLVRPWYTDWKHGHQTQKKTVWEMNRTGYMLVILNVISSKGRVSFCAENISILSRREMHSWLL
jgi:hypothetical protein